MATGRQALLDALRLKSRTEDFVCVADMDNVMIAPPAPASVEAAIQRLRADASLFAVAATSAPFFYDLLALRLPGHDYAGLNAEIAAAKKNPFTYFEFHRTRIYRNQCLMTRPEPILCESSFNGLCIYNSVDYRLGDYRAPNEADVSEHVSMNLSISRKTGKRMLIAPDLVIKAPADHEPVGFFRFWTDRARKLLPLN